MKAHALAAVVVFLAGCTTAAAPALAVTHIDSAPHDMGFVEVFRVDRVTGALEAEALRFTVDGEDVEVTWSGGAPVRVGDRLRFVAESFDRARVLEAWQSNARVLHAEYRGGAGEDLPRNM